MAEERKRPPDSLSCTAPNAQSLRLTATEFAFTSALCDRSREVCGREELFAILTRLRSTFHNRHLDAMVSRLRRKIEEHTCLPVPIKSVYGVGYIFTGSLVPRNGLPVADDQSV